MASFNHCTFIGNLTRPPEVKYLQSGTAVCDIGLAINNRVKKQNEWVDEPCFLDCVAFGKTAEVMGEYLSKGSNILVAGTLRLEQWEKDGQKRSKHKLSIDVMQMLGGKSSEGGSKPRSEHSQETREDYRQDASTGGASSGGDDIPFAPHII